MILTDGPLLAYFERRRLTVDRFPRLASVLSPYINQSPDWLLRHWLTTGVDHESGGIWPLLDREQTSNGVSIEVQHRAVERVAEANGWEMMWLADEGVSGAVPPESRKRFKAALALLDAGESEALIFTKVDRASRCTEDFARLSVIRGAGLTPGNSRRRAQLPIVAMDRGLGAVDYCGQCGRYRN